MSKKQYVIYKKDSLKRFYTGMFQKAYGDFTYANESNGGWSTEIEHAMTFSKKQAKQLIKSRNGGKIIYNFKKFRLSNNKL